MAQLLNLFLAHSFTTDSDTNFDEYYENANFFNMKYDLGSNKTTFMVWKGDECFYKFQIF